MLVFFLFYINLLPPSYFFQRCQIYVNKIIYTNIHRRYADIRKICKFAADLRCLKNDWPKRERLFFILFQHVSASQRIGF